MFDQGTVSRPEVRGRSPALPLAQVPVIVMCGGKGTRIREITGQDIPKPLLKVGNRTLLEHTLALLRENGMHRIILAVSHQARRIRDFLAPALAPGIAISYSETAVTQGVLHALLVACREYELSQTFLLTGADEICEGLDLAAAYRFHRQVEAGATMVVADGVLNEERFYEVEIDDCGRVVKMMDGVSPRSYTMLGYTFFEPDVLAPLAEMELTEVNDSLLFTHLIPSLIRDRRLYGWVGALRRYFHIGNPQAYHKACSAITSPEARGAMGAAMS